MASIAGLYGVSRHQLAQTNGLAPTAWVYIGQRLIVPRQSIQSTDASQTSHYIIRRGDTLATIAYRYDVSIAALQTINNLANRNIINIGQHLIIPNQASTQTTQEVKNVEIRNTRNKPKGEKWIQINLSNQTITAYEGQEPVLKAVVSTGKQNTPTVAGTFRIKRKYDAVDMSGNYGGDSYYVKDVPHVMYFYGAYAIHGTYWHNNFGTPMSHGCVNLSLSDAQRLYDWASVGTKVVVQR